MTEEQPTPQVIATESSAEVKKKPFYKKAWFWIVIAVVVIAGIYSTIHPAKISDKVHVGDTYEKVNDTLTKEGLFEGSNYQTAPKASEMTALADKWKVTKIDDSTDPATITFEKTHAKAFDKLDLVNKDWSEASKEVSEAGYDSTEYEVKTDDGKSVMMKGNWTVESITKNGSKPVVNLKHKATSDSEETTGDDKKESSDAGVSQQGDTSTQSATPSEKATKSGLTVTYAMGACDLRGQQEFPYGYNPAHVFGAISEEVMDDNIFLQYTAKVKNGYNAKREVTITCNVNGTNTAPVVFGWLAN